MAVIPRAGANANNNTGNREVPRRLDSKGRYAIVITAKIRIALGCGHELTRSLQLATDERNVTL